MLTKGHCGFVEAYDAIRVPKKYRLREPPEFTDLPDPDLFDYSA